MKKLLILVLVLFLSLPVKPSILDSSLVTNEPWNYDFSYQLNNIFNDLGWESVWDANNEFQYQPPCDIGWGFTYEGIPNLTIMGDSRSFGLARAENSGGVNISDGGYRPVSYANLSDIEIFNNPSSINTMNLGWFGAMATDDLPLSIFWFPFSYIYESDPGRSNWNRRWDDCNSYVTPDKVILQLGGNDMVNHYEKVSQFEAIYLFYNTLLNPLSLISSLVFDQESQLDKELFWFWQFEMKEHQVVDGMKTLANKVMSQSPAHQMLLVDVAPPVILDIKNNPPGISVDWKKSVRLTVYVSRLNRKYYENLVPYLQNEHGYARIHFMDMFNAYLRNITSEGAGYYFNPLGDGIHFTPEGTKAWGRMLAAKMGLIGWFPINQKILDNPDSMAILEDISNDVPVDLSGILGGCDLTCWLLICSTGVCGL